MEYKLPKSKINLKSSSLINVFLFTIIILHLINSHQANTNLILKSISHITQNPEIISSPLNNFKTLTYKDESNDIGVITMNFLRTLFTDTLAAASNDISASCADSITWALNDTNNLYMTKILRDSSKNKNDIGSYYDCSHINYPSTNNTWTSSIKSNLTYIVVHINKQSDWYNVTDTRHEMGNFLWGACVMKGCNMTEWASIVKVSNEISGFSYNLTMEDIKVFDWGYEKESMYHNLFLQMIPILILVFFFLFSLFTCIPVTIFKCCFKKNRKNESSKNKSSSEFDVNKYYDTNSEDKVNNINKVSKQNKNTKTKMKSDNNTPSNITKLEISNKNNSEFNENYEIKENKENKENFGNIENKENFGNKENYDNYESYENVNYTNNSKTSTNYDMNKLSRFENCFKLIENAEEILSNNYSLHNVNINNDSGLSFVKGLRGINTIFFVLGTVFKVLFRSPIKIFCNVAFQNLVQHFSFSMILFGLRFGPRIFFSLSGYCLVYKLLCYLDSEVEKLENESFSNNSKSDKNEIKEKSKSNNKNLDTSILYENDKTYTIVDNKYSSNMTNHKNYKNTENTKENNINRNYTSKTSNSKIFSNSNLLFPNSQRDFSSSLKFNSLFYFISLQIYKYILYFFAAVILKYSFYSLIGALYSPGPIWVYLKTEIIDKFTFFQMLSVIFLFSCSSESTYYIYDLLWPVTNEIIFFLLFSFLIFIFYKKNWRFDLFLIISFCVLVSSKIGIYLLIKYTSTNVDYFLPALSFYHTDGVFITKNYLYNMPSYLIGLFFGLVNYCIQKSIHFENERKDSLNQSNYSNTYYTNTFKALLLIPCKFRTFYKRNQFLKVFVTSFFFLILFCGTVTAYMIIYRGYFSSDVHMNEFYHNVGVNIFFSVDVEFGILFMFLIVIPLFLTGDNFVICFLKHDYWNFFARPYFIFLILVNFITLYVFYQSESRIKLELFNIIFFTLLVLMIVMIICVACYILFEVPMKKLNKLIMETNQGEKEVSEES